MTLFHFHKWKLIGAEPFKCTQHGYWLGGTFQPFPMPVATDRTKLLYRCQCERYKTREVDGVWSLDELRSQG